MNPSKRVLWVSFWIGVVLVVTTLSWASMAVYSLEERNATARAENQRQEMIRLALWRMDSRLAPMIALEAARPIEDYEIVLSEDGPLDDRADQKDQLEDESIESGSYARGYFEVDASGRAKGSGERAQRIAARAATQEVSSVSKSNLKEYSIKADELASMLTEHAESDEVVVTIDFGDVQAQKAELEPESDYLARQRIADLAQNTIGNQNRSRTSKMVASDVAADLLEKKLDSSRSADQSGLTSARSEPASSPTAGMAPSSEMDYMVIPEAQSGSVREETHELAQPKVEIGAIEPRWIRDESGMPELVLVRTIDRDGVVSIQGVWLDWDTISSELIGSIDDLLPTSVLEPIDDANLTARSNESLYRLATVPVAFIPGGAIAVEGDSLTPAVIAMLVTWIAVMIAMIAVGLVLRTVLTLSARRGHFVGAVTHELRTPLTTFRLYSQMLADGMVTDENVRKEYLNTLKRESDRLTGIVENVLEYARISRQPGRQKDKPKGEQQLSVGELMARLIPPMSRLGEQAGMDLIVSDETSASAERTVTLDPHAVERIMMNLMDNACKYAGGESGGGSIASDDPDLRVHLDAKVENNVLLLIVADHGPGVHSRDRRKIFGEFVRGSSPSMRDRSGLGLGLALSRGLALEMGGDLALVRKRGHGAEFELSIPLDQLVVVSSERAADA
ncbi:MAG: sensor histidine kinase [Phycisphaerales bacterium]